MTRIHLNGEPRTLPAPTTIAALVESLTGGHLAHGIAVARNGEVVPRDDWESAVSEGDEIEVVRAVEGG